MIIATLFAALLAASMYQVEVADDGSTRILGEDGQRREVVIMAVDDYAAVTGAVTHLVGTLNATEDGRVKLHGRRKGMTVYKDGLFAVTEYEDGYRHTEEMVNRRELKAAPKPANEEWERRRTYARLTARRKELETNTLLRRILESATNRISREEVAR